MRVLHIRQKKLLIKWYIKYLKDNPEEYPKAKDIPADLWETLESINDHETMYQNIENFLWDLRCKVEKER